MYSHAGVVYIGVNESDFSKINCVYIRRMFSFSACSSECTACTGATVSECSGCNTGYYLASSTCTGNETNVYFLSSNNESISKSQVK